MLAALLALASAVVTTALPPAPGVVVYAAKEMGEVRFDHAAHVARRERCASCHDVLPVRRVEMDRMKAHTRCRGCHSQRAAGPITCRRCHAVLPTVALQSW